MPISIIIPTFNRLIKAKKQIDFLVSEKSLLKDKVQFILSDNASNTDISEKLENHCKSHGFHYVRNKKNLGLVGNLTASLNIAKYEYVWFVGDDDVLSIGILENVISKVTLEQPDLLFINHYATLETENKIVMESALPPSWIDKESGSMLDVFRFSGTTMMFITACVYKTKILKEAIQTDQSDYNRITAPLYWSLVAAQDNNISYIIEKKINNIWGGTSWSENAREIFDLHVPKELQKCIHMRYNKKKSISIFIRMKFKELKFRFKSLLKL